MITASSAGPPDAPSSAFAASPPGWDRHGSPRAPRCVAAPIPVDSAVAESLL